LRLSADILILPGLMSIDLDAPLSILDSRAGTATLTVAATQPRTAGPTPGQRAQQILQQHAPLRPPSFGGGGGATTDGLHGR